MMKNRSLSLICFSLAWLDVSTANAQAVPPAPGRAAPAAAPAPRPVAPPPIAPAAQPAMPTTPDTAGRGIADMAHTPMERAVPERPVPELQDLEPQPGG